jgi:hypothetical protein
MNQILLEANSKVFFLMELYLILVIGIHFLHMVTCDFFPSKYGNFFFYLPKKPLENSHWVFYCHHGAKICPEKKTYVL